MSAVPPFEPHYDPPMASDFTLKSLVPPKLTIGRALALAHQEMRAVTVELDRARRRNDYAELERLRTVQREAVSNQVRMLNAFVNHELTYAHMLDECPVCQGEVSP